MTIDLILIGIVLLFALIGLCKGFINTIISFFRGTTSVVVAILLAKPVSLALSSVKINEMVSNVFEGLNVINNAITEQSFNNILSQNGGTLTGEIVGQNLVGKLSILIKTFFSNLFSSEVVYTSYMDLSSRFNYACGTALTIVIAFILVYILIKVVLGLLNKIFTNEAGSRRFGALDRLLGMLFGILKACLLIVVFMFAINISSLIPVVGNATNNIIEGTKIASTIYGWVSTLFTNIVSSIDFNALVQSMLN